VRLDAASTWSDVAPFYADDVAFTYRAAYDGANGSVMAASMTVGGGPIVTTVIDAHHVKLTFAAPFAPGVRVLDALPIYPRHALAASLADGTLAKARGLTTAPAAMPGLGPFVIESTRRASGSSSRATRDTSGGTVTARRCRIDRSRSRSSRIRTPGSFASPPAGPTFTSRPPPAGLPRVAGRRRPGAASHLVDVGRASALPSLVQPRAARRARRVLQADAFREAISLADRKAFADAVISAWRSVGAAGAAVEPAWLPDEVTPPAHDPARAGGASTASARRSRPRQRPRGRVGRRALRVLVQSGVPPAKAVQFVRDDSRGIGIGLDVVGLDVRR
jgi:hypothetical protein